MTLIKSTANRIVLNIGELVFGGGSKSLHTLLGSCIAITLWHPKHKLSGMCHFALPSNPENSSERELDARYGDDCVKLFKRLTEERKVPLSEFKARIFGGGNMLESSRLESAMESQITAANIGEINAAQAFSKLLAEGVTIMEADVGEEGYRKVDFDPTTGVANVEFVSVEKKKQTTIVDLKQKILIVDDSLETRTILTRSLRKAGYETEQARNGIEAVAVYERFQPDIILMDMMMPIMDGVSATKQLREANAEQPILMLTGSEELESMAQAFDAGATDFISKPIRVPVLKQHIYNALSSLKKQ
ncbi:response regulator [Idiomarina seosinensis]|uniref:response regulator n=1 Tax=Idiomarina seosinensis TaxID=281739 RepID=UPI00384B418F